MRWRDQRESDNVEDRRNFSGKGLAVGGGVGGLVIVVIVLLLGGDPEALLQQVAESPDVTSQSSRPASPAEEELKKFVSVVLADTEDVWHDRFRQMGRQYREPKLVLFRDQVQSACGVTGTAVGPFYCPADERVYIDLAFYQELRARFRAPGDFAQAYVIAHEVGHHVQKLLGISNQVSAMQARVSRGDANRLSVRLELQADFLAGLWAHYAQNKGIVEPGDLEEALRAASAIGDDRIQMRSQGYIVRDSFTHGTSGQRFHWFQKGFMTGDMAQSDTFADSGI
jgi:predicted metalloprotease